MRGREGPISVIVYTAMPLAGVPLHSVSRSVAEFVCIQFPDKTNSDIYLGRPVKLSTMLMLDDG